MKKHSTVTISRAALMQALAISESCPRDLIAINALEHFAADVEILHDAICAEDRPEEPEIANALFRARQRARGTLKIISELSAQEHEAANGARAGVSS